MTAPRITAEEIAEYRQIAIAPVEVGGMPGLHKLLDALESAYAELDRKDKELETERNRLAACGVAALGYFDGCCDEYKSASLSDVLRLRAELDRLSAQGGEVPEPTDDDLEAIVFDVGGDPDNGFERALVHNGWAWLARRFRPAPPHPDTVEGA